MPLVNYGSLLFKFFDPIVAQAQGVPSFWQRLDVQRPISAFGSETLFKDDLPCLIFDLCIQAFHRHFVREEPDAFLRKNDFDIRWSATRVLTAFQASLICIQGHIWSRA